MILEEYLAGRSLESLGTVENSNEVVMKHKVFSVFDDKAKAYLPPFFLHTSGMAFRAFQDACRDEGHQFCKHPEDYVLFEIGEFDDVKGVLTGLTPHSVVVTGVVAKAGSVVDENA